MPADFLRGRVQHESASFDQRVRAAQARAPARTVSASWQLRTTSPLRLASKQSGCRRPRSDARWPCVLRSSQKHGVENLPEMPRCMRLSNACPVSRLLQNKHLTIVAHRGSVQPLTDQYQREPPLTTSTGVQVISPCMMTSITPSEMAFISASGNPCSSKITFMAANPVAKKPSSLSRSISS